MITFKRFITESANADLNILDAKTIARVIFEDCKPFLRESKFDPERAWETGLFRGLEFNGPQYPTMKFAATMDRPPKDSPRELQKVLDEYFKEKFGYRFRADGTFCTAKSAPASEYGDVYMIFPVGEYKFCYSTVIHDAYNFFDNRISGGPPTGLSDMEKAFGEEIPAEKQIEADSDGWFELVGKYLRMANPYTTVNLAGARLPVHGSTRNVPEIMLGCKYYYGLYAPEFPSENPAREKTDDVLAELFQLLQPDK